MVKALADFLYNHDEYTIEYLKLAYYNLNVYETKFYNLNQNYISNGKMSLSSIDAYIGSDFFKEVKPYLEEIENKKLLTLDDLLVYIEIFSQALSSVIYKYNLKRLPHYKRKFCEQYDLIRRVTISIEKDPNITYLKKPIYKGTLYENGKFKSAKIKLYPGESELCFTFYSVPLTEEVSEEFIDYFTNVFFFKMNICALIKITEVL